MILEATIKITANPSNKDKTNISGSIKPPQILTLKILQITINNLLLLKF